MKNRRKMRVRDKPLKGSGSFPLVAKSIASKTAIRGFYSSTNLLASRKMKRLISRGTHNKRKLPLENNGRNLRGYRLQNEKGIGDIFDLIPKRCVQVRAVGQGAISKCDDPHGTKPPLLSSTPRFSMPPLPSKHNGHPDIGLSHASSPDSGSSRHIDVIVRIRPKNRQEENSKTIVWRKSNSTLLFDPKEKETEFYFKGKRQYFRSDFGKKRPNKDLPFGFDYVYGPESSNQELFDISLKKLIDQVLDGFNCTIFAYGATGSGKTYTMLGSPDTPGICVLMAEELYRRLEILKENFMTEVAVSYLEVYNETIKDLLKPDKELYIREDGKRGIIIPDLTIHTPQGPQDLLRLLKAGNSSRSQHATDLNAESSRSHAVFQIIVIIRQRSVTDKFKMRTSTSRLFMVDLAGSEKGITNGFDGLRQREGANINKSLLALSNCINALADGKSHIPYRNSKLTRLLKDSLSGNCVTVMIANVSPSDLHYEDTHNTLHYANRAKHIRITCKQNTFSEELVDQESAQVQISELQDQVRYLTGQLELERSKKQSIREHQMAKGDGETLTADAGESVRTNAKKIIASSDIVSNQHSSVIAHFLELMKRKTELMEEFTDACIEARLHEWEMSWKRLLVNVADFLGKLDVSDPHFITLAKLKNAESNLSTQYPDLISVADETKEQLELLNEQIQGSCSDYLNNKGFKLDGAFLSVTFQEFISHKKLETDMVRVEKLQKFHQHFNHILYRELMDKEIHLLHAMKFMQVLQSQLGEKHLLTAELKETFRVLLSPCYGAAHNFSIPSQAGRNKTSIQDELSNIEKTITQPVVNLPGNEPTLEKKQSELPLPIQIESSELSTTTWVSNDDPVDTSGKDTRGSSAEENQEIFPFPGDLEKIKSFAAFSNNQNEHFHRQEKETHSQEKALPTTTSATTNVCFVGESRPDFLAEDKELLDASDSKKQELQQQHPVRKRKPLGNITSRVSPGSSFLRNDPLGSFYSQNEFRLNNNESRSEDKCIRSRRSKAAVRSGRALTNIADAAFSSTAIKPQTNRCHFSEANRVQCDSRPPIIPSRRKVCQAQQEIGKAPSECIFSYSESSDSSIEK